MSDFGFSPPEADTSFPCENFEPISESDYSRAIVWVRYGSEFGGYLHMILSLNITRVEFCLKIEEVLTCIQDEV